MKIFTIISDNYPVKTQKKYWFNNTAGLIVILLLNPMEINVGKITYFKNM